MNQGLAGTGVVARDDQQIVICGRITKYDSIRDPLVIETLACRDAMALAIERVSCMWWLRRIVRLFVTSG